MLAAAVAHAAEFPAAYKKRPGVLTVDESGVSYAGVKNDRWSWKFEDIERLTVSPDRIAVLTYQDNRYRLGADRRYEFTGKIPARELHDLLKGRLDQRFVAALADATFPARFAVPAKHLRPITGGQGMLSFGSGVIAWSTALKDDSRTWRYQDVANISSNGPFDLTITTLEKTFHFQLKQPLPEARYNELWMEIEQENGKIQ
jgi:hypothetical protein